ncbi:MAG: orotidine-5'-phosphate decarboxylase, partial [Flavobacteriales bacterium]
EKIPSHLRNGRNPVLDFNKRIIDATAPFAVAYKPNLAFYEQAGARGWEMLKKTFDYIPEGILKIADGKRGDIGNTSGRYAEACFEQLGADAVTINPYMGKDAVEPFLEGGTGRWGILLALTSNTGADDFELQKLYNGHMLYEEVIERSKAWGTPDKLMYVVGATRPEAIAGIRKMVPKHFLLVPGVGAQGGNLEKVALFGMNEDCGLIVNASRSIIYAGDGPGFAEKAAVEAEKLQKQMAEMLRKHSFIQ